MASIQDVELGHRLVGQYMASWALVEAGLVHAIQAASGMTFENASIIGANTSVREKIAITRTMINRAPKTDQWKVRADFVVREVAKHSAERNIVAHSVFGAEHSHQATVFLRTLAKTHFEFAEMAWSIDDFNSRFAALGKLRKHLDEITKDLRNPDVLIGRGRAKLNLKLRPPDRLSVVAPPPQESRSGGPTKRQSKRQRREGRIRSATDPE